MCDLHTIFLIPILYSSYYFMFGNIARLALKSDNEIQDSFKCNKFPDFNIFTILGLWIKLHSSLHSTGGFDTGILVTPRNKIIHMLIKSSSRRVKYSTQINTTHVYEANADAMPFNVKSCRLHLKWGNNSPPSVINNIVIRCGWSVKF